MPVDTLKLTCPAKVNLALSVGPPAANGYHRIASWMLALRFGDAMHIQRLEPGQPTTCDIRFAANAPVPQPIDWPLQKDLAWRAHQLVEEAVGKSLPIALTLEKHIPTGAGLGGGSSDAAGMLVGLNRLFELKLHEKQLIELAQLLGSDIAFLVAALHGKVSALVTGFGEKIEPCPLPDAVHLVLLLPPWQCPTAAVYAAFDKLTPDAEVRETHVRQMSMTPPPVDQALFNDLAAAAGHVQPELAQCVQRLRERGLPIHVTGSGAAMFLLATDADHAQTLAAKAAELTQLATVVTRSI